MVVKVNFVRLSIMLYIWVMASCKQVSYHILNSTVSGWTADMSGLAGHCFCCKIYTLEGKKCIRKQINGFRRSFFRLARHCKTKFVTTKRKFNPTMPPQVK